MKLAGQYQAAGEEKFCPMTLKGVAYTEKADAGEMLLAVCKENPLSAPVEIGSYRGFRMEVYYDTLNAHYCLNLCGKMKHSGTNLAKSTVEALRENFGNQIKMYRTYIPIAVKAAETSSKGKSIFAYEPNSTVSKAYTEFTKEVLADGRKKERLHSHEAR